LALFRHVFSSFFRLCGLQWKQASAISYMAPISCAHNPAHPEQTRIHTMMSMMLRPRAGAGRRCCLRARRHAPFAFAAIALAVVSAAATTAPAQNRFWITNTGGAFASSANWATTNTPPGGASVPGVADVANFTRGSVYTVTFSADVTNAGLLLNNDSVTFDLGGKTYTTTTSNNIGTTAAQTGRLTIKNGTLGVDTAPDQILLGAVASTGFLTVSTGGRIGGAIDPNVVVGNGGTATFMVEDNGFADLGYIILGQANTGAMGTATISGPNAVMTTSNGILVGNVGTGNFNVQSAGTVTNAGATIIGVLLGSNGTAKVSGIGSKWIQTGTLIVGDAGDAALNVEAAGVLDTAGAVRIGNASTGIGTAIVTGADSTLNMAGVMQIGVDGLGNFAITSGGRATTTGTVQMSLNGLSESNAVVSGAGSRWTTGAITVGSLGNANLTVNGGGVLETTGNATIANGAASLSKAIVSGAGSAWNISGSLNIAGSGTGTLNIDSDASLAATGALTIGDPAGTQVGTLNFNGGTISAGSFTRVGASAFNWTDGTLLINGGAFNNGGANLVINGSALDDLPALRLSSGATSAVAQLPNLTIGSDRQGALIVSGGSNFQTTTAALGGADGGSGSLHVEGLGSTFSTTGDLGVGGTTAAAGGLGGVTLGPGGTVTANGTLRLWGGGSINIAGGTLRFNTLAANGGKTSFSSGTVQVLTDFNANAAALDALLGPAHTLGVGRTIETPDKTMNLQSNLTVSGGAVAGNVLALTANIVARFDGGGTGTFNGGITNPAGARIYVTDATVGAGTTFSNGGELHLADSTATVNGTGLSNSGLVEGSGRINSTVTNNAAGQVRVAAGQRLEVLGASGTNVNNGLVDVDGGAIEFGRAVINSNVSPSSGLIAARNATLRFQAGLLNSGALTFSAGVSDVFGDVTNQNNLTTPGRIVVTGGAQANFFDDVVNGGSIQVSAAGSLQSTAVFLGSLSGSGVTGTGHVFLEGDTRPGFSPGTMAFGGDVSFGPLSTLNIELAGTTPGTQYDRVTVAESVAIGGELNVSLLNNFKPVIGDTFQIVTATDVDGTFFSVVLPQLAGGASWDLNYGAGAVSLSVGGVLGDFNLDGRVDTADYTVWRNKFGTNFITADASGNGSVDQADYNIWKANYGAVAANGGGAVSSIAAVPEPASLVVAAGMAIAMVGCGWRRGRLA
jgi:T5SS/PEP-CTERM-associated repeat protein